MTEQTKVKSELPITLEYGGKSYSGKYWEEFGMIWVKASGPKGTSPLRYTKIGRTPPATLAQILLGNMVRSGLVNPDAPNKKHHWFK